jgi:hypothetical protein
MRRFTRTIIVLVVFCLATASPGMLQSPEGKIQTFTISGNAGTSGVTMTGLPGDLVTDERGYYIATVYIGWAGTVKPVKEGYTFNPAMQIYTGVIADQKNQNYTAEQLQRKVWQFESGRWEPMQEGVDGRGSGQTRRSTGYSSAIAPTASRKLLVVPAAEIKAQDIAEIIEDMQIMSHILDERFKETRRVQGAFTDFGDFFGRDNRATEATYLQGYGVLFSMEVNFAFSPPPKPQGQETKQPAENADSTWQRAKQQVFSPGDSRGPGGSGSSEEYNSQMVEELKRDLITTLKHAANIRGVQAEELVILTVIGGGRQSRGVYGGGGYMMGGMGGASVSGGGGMMGGGMSGSMGGGMMSGGMGGMSSPGEMSVSPATVLTIRAKKSDIDAYAKGELDFEQFNQKVDIFTY